MNISRSAIFLEFMINKKGRLNFDQSYKNSSLASTRLQLYPLYEALNKMNIKCKRFSLHSEHLNTEIFKEKSFLTIVGKLSANSNHLISSMAMANLAAVCRQKRCKSVQALIYSDNHIIKKTRIGELYRDLIYYSDLIICPTQALKESLKNHSLGQGKNIYVVEDPWQVEEHSYHKSSSSNCLNLLWFGSGLNAQYLINILPQIYHSDSQNKQLRLTILSSLEAIEFIKNKVKSLNLSAKKIKFTYLKWKNNNQPNQLQEELHRAEIVLIPSDPNDPAKLGVSHNRLVDSIRAGCIPIASPMQSYKELSSLAIIGNNFSSMMSYVAKNQYLLRRQYNANRCNIIERFSPTANKLHWQSIVQSIINSES